MVFFFKILYGILSSLKHTRKSNLQNSLSNLLNDSQFFEFDVRLPKHLPIDSHASEANI